MKVLTDGFHEVRCGEHKIELRIRSDRTIEICPKCMEEIAAGREHTPAPMRVGVLAAALFKD